MNETGNSQPINSSVSVSPFAPFIPMQEKYPNLKAGNPGNNGGKPTKYDVKFSIEIIQYFINAPKQESYIKKEKIVKKSNGTEEIEREYAIIAAELPTLDKFARKIGVDGATLYRWANVVYKEKETIPKELWGKYKHAEFRNSYNAAKILQREFLTDNALKGLYPPASFIFIAKNVTEMRDKQEIDHTTKGKEIPAPILSGATTINVPTDNSNK